MRYERTGAVCTGHIPVIVDTIHFRARTAWCEDILDLAIHEKKPAAVPVRIDPRTDDDSRRIYVVQRGAEGIRITERLVNSIRQHEPVRGIRGKGHGLGAGLIPAYDDPCVADARGICVNRPGGIDGGETAVLPHFESGPLWTEIGIVIVLVSSHHGVPLVDPSEGGLWGAGIIYRRCAGAGNNQSMIEVDVAHANA